MLLAHPHIQKHRNHHVQQQSCHSDRRHRRRESPVLQYPIPGHAALQRLTLQLGKAMAEEIAARPEAMTLLATSRRGTDLDLKPANPQSKIVYPKLDLVQPGSIEALLKLVKAEYGGKVDVLLLNAGAHFDEVDNSTFSKDLAKQTMDLSERWILPFPPDMLMGDRLLRPAQG